MKRTLLKLARQVNKRLVQVQNDYLRGTVVLGRPFQITVEPGNLCNLKCPLCPTTHREQRLPKGMMKAAEAEKIFDAFPLAVQVVLSNWGEPFLNGDVFEIIAEAKKRDLNVRLESHFNNFDRSMAERLVASGLDKLVIALDGTTQEAYESYRVGGDLEQVIENVKLLKEVQREKRDARTEVIWKFVINKHNQHQVEDARAWARRLDMTFEEVPIWAPPGEGKDWHPTREADRAGREEEGTPSKCHNLWQAVSVNFNGDVHPCCSEFAPEERLGNVLEEGFGGIWNSKAYRERRARNKGPVDCSRCHEDRETNWAKRWMPQDVGPEGE